MGHEEGMARAPRSWRDFERGVERARAQRRATRDEREGELVAQLRQVLELARARESDGGFGIPPSAMVLRERFGLRVDYMGRQALYNTVGDEHFGRAVRQEGGASVLELECPDVAGHVVCVKLASQVEGESGRSILVEVALDGRPDDRLEAVARCERAGGEPSDELARDALELVLALALDLVRR